MKIDIPKKYSIDNLIEHNTYLINGKIDVWKGEFVDV